MGAKSVSCEHTFAEDISTKVKVTVELYNTVLELEQRIRKSGFQGRTLTLKVKYSDFQQITRSITQDRVLLQKDDILPLAKQLMSQVDFSASHPIRLLGLGVSGHADDDAKKVQPRPEWRELELEFLPW